MTKKRAYYSRIFFRRLSAFYSRTEGSIYKQILTCKLPNESFARYFISNNKIETTFLFAKLESETLKLESDVHKLES